MYFNDKNIITTMLTYDKMLETLIGYFCFYFAFYNYSITLFKINVSCKQSFAVITSLINIKPR